ncbi:YafY family protein [Actinotalea sp. K2]|uniref:helix-turn-helix transcriptional regulator n=1 Tax=Actinotalea sp. K2 TaxID=2939438 RepID=UPI0020176E37|nr:YafY family protein [Actinotalea sp. K2]MCL3859443.1 YafY family transcriptional regulator [Actinotalea sp. K2]
MRADRLLSLLWILRARGSITASAAALELGVSTRTILRDVESLSTAGVPVYCLPGRGGGIHLDPGFRTDVTGLTPHESQALFTAAATSGAYDLGLHDALASARRKLTAALPAGVRDTVDVVTARVVIDAGDWLPARRSAHLDTLQHAVMADRRVRIGYRSRGTVGNQERCLDTYGLICSAGTWYLAAACEGRPRFYHLARISSVELLDEQADRPGDLNLRQLWEDSRSRFRARFIPETVDTFARSSRIGELLSLVENLQLPAAHALPTDADLPPGYVRVLLSFSDRSHAVEVLRRFGPDVLVVEPTSLRDEIVAEAQATCRAYGSPRESAHDASPSGVTLAGASLSTIASL